MINLKSSVIALSAFAALLTAAGVALADNTPPNLSECQAAITGKASNSAAVAALLDQCMQYNVCSQLDNSIPNCNNELGAKDFIANYLSNPVLQSNGNSLHSSYHSNVQPDNNAATQSALNPYKNSNVVTLPSKKQKSTNNNIHWF